MRPVVVDERVLIDGGATNPLPFDVLRGRADVVVAIDISGEPIDERRDIPNPWECLATTVLVMGNAITDREAQARRARPDRAAKGRLVPHARFSAGERDPAGVRTGQGGGEGAAGQLIGR